MVTGHELDDPREETFDAVDYAGTVARVRARMFGSEEPAPAFGRHRVEGVLGKGAMGRVYLARDPQLDRLVAIKQVRPRGSPDADSSNTDRLRREAEILAALAHPNVLEVYEVGRTTNGATYIVMEYVAGGDFGARLEDRACSWRERFDLLLQAGDGLAAAHEAGLIHRDVKPANILVGSDGRARLADFGLAYLDPASTDRGESTASQIDARVGTPAFMAPELLKHGVATPASDQYAFGLCVHLALTGGWPKASFAEGLRGRAPPVDADRVPAAIRRVVARATLPDPAERFASMAAMLGALRHAARSRARGRAILGFGAAAAAAVVVLVAWRPSSKPEADCGDDDQLATVWNAAVRASLAERLSNLGPRGEAMFKAFEARLDELVGAWGRARVRACVDARQEPNRHTDLRLRCLDRQRTQLAVLLTAVSSDEAIGLDAARSAVERIPDPTECEDTKLLEQGLVGITDPGTREELRAIGDELMVLQLRATLEPPERLIPPADELVDRARASGHAWTLAEALETRSQLGLARHDPEALDGFEAAFHTAIEAGNRRIAARAAGTLAKETLERDREEGRRWLEHAVANADGFPRTQAQLAGIEANLSRAEGDCAAALEASTRAVTMAEASTDAVLFGRQLDGAASIALQCDDLDRASAWATRGHEILAQALGPEHVGTGVARFNLGHIASLEGRLDESAAHLQSALEVFEAADGGVGAKSLAARNGLAIVLSERDPVGALPEFIRTLADARQLYGDEHPALIALELNVAMCKWYAGEHADALAHADASLRLGETFDLHDDSMRARGHLYRGRALAGLGRLDEAFGALDEAVRVLGPSDDAKPSADRGEVLLARGLLRLRHAEPEVGSEEARRGLEMMEAALPAGDPKAVRARAWYTAAGLR